MRQLPSLVCAALVAVVFAAPASADEGEGPRTGKNHIFDRLDKNQDGALVQDEVPARLWQRIANADADENGAVTKAELKAFRESKRAERAESGQTASAKGRRAGKRGRRARMRRRALKRLDKNEDKALSQDEVPAKLWERISKADANGDGAVTRDEVKALRKAKRAERKETGQTIGAGKGRAGKRKGRRGRRARRGFQRLDTNGDGVLTQDEVPAKIWERIVQADSNGDGQVTKEEAKAFRKGKRAEKEAK